MLVQTFSTMTCKLSFSREIERCERVNHVDYHRRQIKQRGHLETFSKIRCQLQLLSKKEKRALLYRPLVKRDT